MYAGNVLTRTKRINESWRPKPMLIHEEAAIMARLAITRGEAGTEDVRREAKNSLIAHHLSEVAARHAAEIIVPQPAPEAEPS